MNIKANGYWYRYSNTLLVSLNNRISIREVLSGGGGLLTSGTLPDFTAKDGPNIVRLEMEKPSYAFEERKQQEESVEDDGRKGVIRKYCGASFPIFFQRQDLINRYRMIWILDGRMSWTTVTTTGSVIYFCTVTYKSCSRHRRTRRKDCVYSTGWRLISFHFM